MRRFSLLVIVASFALALVGCSGGAKEATQPATTAPAAQKAAE